MRTVLIAFGILVVAVSGLVGWIYATTNLDVTTGRGWRLLAVPNTIPRPLDGPRAAYADLVDDADGTAALEKKLGTKLSVDLASEVVVWVVGIGSGSCPLHFDGLEITEDTLVATATAGFRMTCTTDAHPYTFVLAVKKSALPDPLNSIRVETDDTERQTEYSPPPT